MTYQAHPLRIQRKRTKGWRMPSDAVYVGRPTKWANPFPMTYWRKVGKSDAEARRIVATDFTRCLVGGDCPLDGAMEDCMDRIKRDIHELRGKTLVCWCPLDQPCHADALAQLANPEREENHHDR